LDHPRLLVFLLGFMYSAKQFKPPCWLLLIQLISFPGILVLIALKGLRVVPSELGRLAALNTDGAGKRRIIAITDFWTQLVFRPFHDCLFRMLKLIEQDGTFDQWKPIETWVLPRLRLGFPAFSFDLTAATDRLPIQFQGQVFEILLGNDYLVSG